MFAAQACAVDGSRRCRLNLPTESIEADGQMQNDAGKTRHYLALDGLRGVAALMVFGSHIELMQHVRGVFSHSYLAVDFFFVLSGFVIGHAYEQKLGTRKLSLREFVFARWLRLYPLMFLGALLGLASAFMHPVAAPIVLALLGQLLFVPLFAGDEALYLLNPVQWSLLFEGFANATHAVSLKWLSTRTLIILCATGFAMLAFFQLRHQTFDAGFSANTFNRGIGRILFGYPAGLLLYRLNAAGRLPSVKAPFWAVSIALAAVMVVCAYAETFQFVELIAVATFPLVVWAAIGATPQGLERRLADWLGKSSYPLYAVHWPLLALCASFLPHAGWVTPCLLFGGFLIALALNPVDAGMRKAIAEFRASRSRKLPAARPVMRCRVCRVVAPLDKLRVCEACETEYMQAW